MPKRKKKVNPHAFAHDPQLVARRVGLAASGAAGVHADQQARHRGALRTNRSSTRAAVRAAHIKDGW